MVFSMLSWYRAGEEVISEGMRIGSAEVGLLATVGVTHVRYNFVNNSNTP